LQIPSGSVWTPLFKHFRKREDPGRVAQRMAILGVALGQVDDAHYNLGLAFEKMGQSTEAIEHYQQALKIQPDFTAAKDALRRLGQPQ
jgi:Tfp pilus assembly protein PilF